MVLLLLGLAPVLHADSYSEGKAHFSRGNFPKARELFEETTRKNPGNGNAHFYLASILEREGRRAEAIGRYRQAVAGNIEPENREKAYWKLVLHYRYQRDWDNLAAYSSRFLRYKNIPKVQGFLAEAERNRGSARPGPGAPAPEDADNRADSETIASAIERHNKVLERKPENHAARWELALLLMRQKNFDQAARHLRRLVVDGKKWEYHYKLGVCQYHLNDQTGALANFARARTLNQKPDKSFQHFLGLGEGLALLATGEYVQAALARSSFWLGNRIEAERYARQALAGSATDPDALLALGLTQNHDRQKRQALDALKKMDAALAAEGARVPPYFSPGYLILGTLAALNNDHTLSLRALDRVDREYLRGKNLTAISRENAPLNPDPIFDYYYGRGLVETGRPGEALEYLRRVKPTPGVLFLLARAQGARDNIGETRALLTRLFAANPAYRAKAQAEPVFRRLAERNGDFQAFLENGEPAAGEPSPQRGPNPGPPAQAPAFEPGVPILPPLE